MIKTKVYFVRLHAHTLVQIHKMPRKGHMTVFVLNVKVLF
jgi:hypothetical protein